MNLMTKLEALDEIISDLMEKIQPQDTGHIHTTIRVLTEERNKLRNKIAEAIQR